MCGRGYVPGWGIKAAVGPTRIPSMFESDILQMSVVTDAYSSTNTVVYSRRESMASSEANDAHPVSN